MKRFLSLVLALCLLCSFALLAAPPVLVLALLLLPGLSAMRQPLRR